MNILKENKAIGIIVLVIVVLLGWYILSGGSGGSTPLISSNSPSSGEVVDDRELLELLTDMRNLQLDGHIFESPSYTNLQDFSRSIIPEPVGRRDPFAPVEAEIVITGGEEDLSDQVLLR